jgi:hypothetical protein
MLGLVGTARSKLTQAELVAVNLRCGSCAEDMLALLLCITCRKGMLKFCGELFPQYLHYSPFCVLR